MSDAQQPLNALPKGHRLQEYELVRVLGMGGFGMTYLGYDHNLDKGVAIKEYLPSDLATRTTDGSVAPQVSQFRDDFQWGLERFLDEARALARFDHRHIVKVYRFFEAHGTAYIVMEYAEGDTLSEYLEREGPLREGELKKILYPILAGVAVVHEANFLHRDIKPGNIIIRAEDGSPVLLDFGAARQAIGAKSRSITSVVTPGYAPIEQYSSRGNQGPWTDIYALGAVCYRALTGEVPEDATDRVLHDSLVAVSQRCADRARGAFLAAIDGALLVNGANRPQSVAAWREALEADGGEAPEQAADGGEASQSQEKPLLSAIDVALAVDAEDRPPRVAEQVPKRADGGEAPEQAALEEQRKAQAVEEARLAAEQAEKQRREQAALEEQRREQAALEKPRQEEQPQQKLPLPPLPNYYPTQRSTRTRLKRLGVVFGIVALLLVGDKIYVYHAEQAALEEQRKAQAVKEERLAAEQAEKQRQEQAALEEQRREQAVLEEQRREQAALEKQRQEEQAALEKQRREQAALEQQRREQAALEEQRREQAALEQQRQEEQAVLNKAGVDNLHDAARKNAYEAAEVLLRQGANVHAKQDDGGTPLHMAAKYNASGVAEVLLRQGANVHAKQDDGGTPLHMAAKYNASGVAEVLLRQGADIHAKDKYGFTPLHVAAWHDASAVAEVLLRQGANVSAKTNNGSSPLHIAAWHDASATAEVLRRYGGRK